MIITALIGTMPTSFLRVKSKRNPLKVGDLFWGMPPADYDKHPIMRGYFWKQYKVTAVVKDGDGVFYRVIKK